MAGADLFSEQASAYAAFRPAYPKKLYEFLLQHVPGRKTAWDCATGNGQAAIALSRYFEVVHATDISAAQLSHAQPAPNVVYQVLPAEKTDFPDHFFDLITVAQALHWLRLPEFYAEVRRTAKPGALFAAWGYSLPVISFEVDILLYDFYRNTVGPYWDAARRKVENRYANLPFPFDEIPAPAFEIKVRWSLQHFEGYVSSWSATAQYIANRKTNPVPDFIRKLSPFWQNELVVTFPLFIRAGRIAH